MMTLYFSPGACSLASHIALEESGAAYEPHQVTLAKGEHKTDEYKKINPRQKVPALQTENGVITENVAILSYVAKLVPEKNLIPRDPAGEAKTISTMAWLSNTVHPGFTRIFRPENFAQGDEAKAEVREAGKKAFWASLQEIDSLLAGKQWMLGDQFTTADGYALVFYGWGTRVEMPMAELKNYTAWKDRMLARPAVRKVLEREKSVLLPKAA